MSFELEKTKEVKVSGDGGREAPRRTEEDSKLAKLRQGLIYFAVAAAAGAVAAALGRLVGAGTVASTVAIAVAMFSVLLIYVVRATARSTGDLGPGEVLGVLGAATGLVVLEVACLNGAGLVPKPRPGPIPVRACLEGNDGPGVVQTTGLRGKGPLRYSKAQANSDVKGALAVGCEVRYVGICVGQMINDSREAFQPDRRWLILGGGKGLVASGQTVATIPARFRPRRCPGGLEPPTSPRRVGATVDRARGRVAITGQAPRAAYIGVAFKRRDGKWQRLGWDRTPGDRRGTAFRLPRGLAPGRPVAAAACIGYRFPVGTPTIAVARRGNAPRPRPVGPVRQPTGTDAGRTACDAGAIDQREPTP